MDTCWLGSGWPRRGMSARHKSLTAPLPSLSRAVCGAAEAAADTVGLACMLGLAARGFFDGCSAP